MSINFAFTTTRPPLRGPGRPPNPLPAGLSDDVIRKIRRRSERMSRASNANFATIFVAKIFAALAETGLARLSPREVMSLAKEADDMPSELAVVIACFLAKHPPVGADYRIMLEAIRRGRIGGVNGLIKLHHHIADRQRKSAAKRRAKQPPLLNRPKLAPLEERTKRRDAAQAQAEAERAAAAKSALERLYPQRHDSRMKPWMTEFIECVETLHSAGYAMTPNHCEQIIDLAEQMSAAETVT